MSVLILFWGGGEGGDAASVIELARALKTRKVAFKVAAYASAYPDIFKEKAERAGLDATSPSPDVFLIQAPETLWEETGLHPDDFDLIHVHHGRTIPKRTDILPLRLVAGKLPLFITAHGPLPLKSIAYGGVKSKVSRYLSPAWFKAVIVPSEAKLREWKEMTPFSRRVKVIPNIVHFFTPTDKAAARKKLGWAPDSEIALFCSRLDAEKDPLCFIEAVARAAANKPKLLGIMAGSGALSEDCARLVKELNAPVELLGYVADPQPLYAAADVFVQTSCYESFCITLMQGAALGLPCVASDIRIFRDFYGDDPGFEWFELGNPESCAQAISRALEHGGRANSLKVLQRFSEDSVVEAHLELWRKAVA